MCQLIVAGISVTEHLEINVVPLAVTLTEKFYNMLQEFFLPKSEEREESEIDHSRIFGGNQRTLDTSCCSRNVLRYYRSNLLPP